MSWDRIQGHWTQALGQPRPAWRADQAGWNTPEPMPPRAPPSAADEAAEAMAVDVQMQRWQRQVAAVWLNSKAVLPPQPPAHLTFKGKQ